MTVAWVLLALAAVVLPVPRQSRVVTGRPVAGSGAEGRATTLRGERTLLAVALGGLAAGCDALAGPATGGVLALIGCPLAGVALRAMQRRPAPRRADRSLALTLDLAAAALRAGRPLADALALAAPAADPVTGRALGRVAGLLRLGADPAQAWSVLARDGPLAPIAVAALRSATSGVRLAESFERLAGEIRTDAAAEATACAHRAGITAMAPLGACFLPAFVCLGVIPVVVGIAGAAFGVLP